MNLKRSRSDSPDPLCIEKVSPTKRQKSASHNPVSIAKAFTRDDTTPHTPIKRSQQRQRFTVTPTSAKQTRYVAEDFHE